MCWRCERHVTDLLRRGALGGYAELLAISRIRSTSSSLLYAWRENLSTPFRMERWTPSRVSTS